MDVTNSQYGVGIGLFMFCCNKKYKVKFGDVLYRGRSTVTNSRPIYRLLMSLLVILTYCSSDLTRQMMCNKEMYCKNGNIIPNTIKVMH